MSVYKFVMLALFVAEVASLTPPCENHTNCRDCVLDQNVCVWCAADYHKANISRCVVKEKAAGDWCPEQFIQRPNATVEEGPGPGCMCACSAQAHIQPTSYKLKLLPGEAVDFTFTLNTTDVDYPVDVYFVIDAYTTVLRDIYKLHTQKIIGALRTITENIKFGFGTFVDKNIAPFCDDRGYTSNCHSFKHHLTLTSNDTEFQEMLEKYPRGWNSGDSLSGLDGVAQAITCKQLGWRDVSVKIVVHTSVQHIHVAGDGKEAGIYNQYDGQCYTDADGVYTKELEMDYPSVDMINKLATDNNVTVLLSYGDSGPSRYYKDFAPKISGNPVLYGGTHFENGDLLLNKLKEITERMTKPLQPHVQCKENKGRNFKITINPDCTKDTDACKFVKNKLYNYTASITMLQYEGLDNYSMDIAVPGVTDKLTLDVEVIKQCECELTIGNSIHCGGETPQNETRTSSQTPYKKENIEYKGMNTSVEKPKNKDKVDPNR